MESSVLFIRKNERHQRIRIDDIQYILAAGSYLQIVTKREKFSVSQNLSQFARKNSIATLVRVHRSYIVNLAWVDSFDNAYVYFGQLKIPIGSVYREKFMERIRCL
jgi:DNA-binding LytR/AlgR family response regulator